MKFRLMLYVFVIMFILNYVLGLRQSIELNKQQEVIEANLSEDYVLNHAIGIEILKHEMELRK